MIIQQFGKLVKQSIQVAMQCSCQLLQRKQVRMLLPASIINGCFCMFDINEINERTTQSEKTLNAISNKIKELKENFDDVFDEYADKDENYFIENPDELNRLNEIIKKRMSLYDLLHETAENIRKQTKKDMQNVYEELLKNQYYE